MSKPHYLQNHSWPTAKMCQKASSTQALSLADNRTSRFDELRSVFDELNEMRSKSHALGADDYLPKSHIPQSLTVNPLQIIKQKAEAIQARNQAESLAKDKENWLLKGLLG